MLVASARFISRWRMHVVSACKFSAVGSVQFSSVVRCGCSRKPICAPHPVITLNLSSTASLSMSECSQSVFAVSRSLLLSSGQNAGRQCLLCLARSRFSSGQNAHSQYLVSRSLWFSSGQNAHSQYLVSRSLWFSSGQNAHSQYLLPRSLCFSSGQNAHSQYLLCLARSDSVQVRMLTVSICCVSLALVQFRSECSQSVFAVSRSLWLSSGQNAHSICCVSLALAQFRSAQLQVTLCKVIFTKRSHLT